MLELSHILLGNKYMYRQSLQARMENEQFITRLGSLPMVNLAWTSAVFAYEKTKDKNALLKTALNMAESSVTSVANTAKPLVDKVQPQIAVVNSFACDKLIKLETAYPVITKPADQVYADSKKICEDYLQPVTSRVSGVYSAGKNQVDRVGQLGSATVNGVKSYSASQIARVQNLGQGILTSSLNTTYGKVAVNSLDAILCSSENLVDKYLPPEEDEVNKVEQNPVFRVTSLTSKVRRRMYKRALRDLRGAQTKSQDALAKLNFTVNLIEYAKTNLDSAKSLVGERVGLVQEKMSDTWTRITSEENMNQGETTQNLEERTILLARQLARQIRHNATIVSKYVNLQPQQLTDMVVKSKKYAEDLYSTFSQAKSFEDIPAWILNQTKEKMSYIKEALSFATDTSLNWLSLDINMENIQLEDPEFVPCNGFPHIPAACPQNTK